MSDDNSFFGKDNDLLSNVPSAVWESSKRKLAKALPIYAIGHANPAVRKLAGDLFELTMNQRLDIDLCD